MNASFAPPFVLSLESTASSFRECAIPRLRPRDVSRRRSRLFQQRRHIRFAANTVLNEGTTFDSHNGKFTDEKENGTSEKRNAGTSLLGNADRTSLSWTNSNKPLLLVRRLNRSPSPPKPELPHSSSSSSSTLVPPSSNLVKKNLDVQKDLILVSPCSNSSISEVSPSDLPAPPSWPFPPSATPSYRISWSSPRPGTSTRDYMSYELTRKHYEQSKREGAFISTKKYNDYILGSMRVGAVATALQLFDEVKSTVGPNTVTYNIMIKGFSDAKRLDQALAMAVEMRAGGVERDVFTYGSLISAHSKEGRADEAMSLLRELEGRNMTATPVIYSSILSALGSDAKRFEEAKQLFDSMESRGVVPDTAVYNAFLNACSNAGEIEEMIKVFNVLKSFKEEPLPLPNTRTYNTVLKGLLRAGLIDEAGALKVEMKQRGIEMDEVSYTTLIDSEVKAGNLDRALMTFNDMSRLALKRPSIHPNAYTYTVLIAALARAQRLSEASRMFDEMKGAGVNPSIHTYTALLDACVRGRAMSKASGLFRELLENNDPSLQPNLVTFNTYLLGLCRSDTIMELDKAFVTLEEMRRRGVHPDTCTYNTLLLGCVRVGDIGRAADTFASMKVAGISVDLYTYNTLITGYCNARDMDLALQVLAHMEEEGIEADLCTYNALLYGFVTSGQMDTAYKLFQFIVRTGEKYLSTQSPSPPQDYYSSSPEERPWCPVLIGNFIPFLKAKKPPRTPSPTPSPLLEPRPLSPVGGLFYGNKQQPRRQPVIADVVTYGTMIEGFLSGNRRGKALEVYRDMCQQGIGRDLRLWYSLLESCRNSADADFAFEILKDMKESGVERSVLETKKRWVLTNVALLSTEVW
eukprot:CAMPEP_0184345096 /NCGR_PEP_ID=MMETSP1089-20130417/13544_1 /TAXON_ID=38269 ORGANISM="Gloeochaete wittrockiana, Strain SAG46.84" /NCGR_SAMPLE_ID=MMETSP1089 /ASSEMBLY_ACC=CAM_ASM_000445 /LENGTH=860 /DNA_ID=CAMNT_0026675263 /DNA_START=1 /DNA_END=2580 /DNA_ORIENTATION=+